jgi:LCP family protein required for cell wall assembly
MLTTVKLRTAFLLALSWTTFFLAFFISVTILLAILVLKATTFRTVDLYLTQFNQAARTTTPELVGMVLGGWQYPVTQTNQRKNLLILGTDSLANRVGQPALTDTLIIASLNLENGQVSLLSLPRDLWLDSAQAKINALYAFGKEQGLSKPEDHSARFISELTSIPIHHTLVISLDQVAQVIDLLGGIEIEVKEGFVDEQFPRSDVDINVVRDPQLLYETVEFKPGRQTMNGDRALKYIRSRHSSGNQGNDTARTQRQQAVIAALIQKVRTPDLWKNPKVAGELFTFYRYNFESSLPPQEVIATARELWPHRSSVELKSAVVSTYPEDEHGVLTHPGLSPTRYFGQWVYIVRDQSLFQSEVHQKLSIPKE